MALMERVATLLRANVNELLDRAQDPEITLKQFVLDLENQLLQVKTQVAMSLAHQHVLERKREEQQRAVQEWHRKAELAVSKGDDALARAVLERALGYDTILAAIQAQVADQTAEAEALRATYNKLQVKLVETKGRCELLIAQHRRARMRSKAGEVAAMGQAASGPSSRVMSRMEDHVSDAEARDRALRALVVEGSLEERLAQLERDDRVEELLAELKSKQRLLATG